MNGLQNNCWILAMDESTHCITFPENFKNNKWVGERAISAAKIIDVNSINCSIQNGIPAKKQYISQLMELSIGMNF